MKKFNIGDKVNHDIFGNGVVVYYGKQSEESFAFEKKSCPVSDGFLTIKKTVITVLFEDGKKRTFTPDYLNFAN